MPQNTHFSRPTAPWDTPPPTIRFTAAGLGAPPPDSGAPTDADARPAALAPRADAAASPRRRLVPKKSRLGLLGDAAKNTLTKNTLTKNTLAKNTLTKNTLTKNTLTKNTLTKNTLARTAPASSANNDLSDVVRRVGADGAGGGGFDIYVDRCADAEDASILMVRKQRSRAHLGDVQWAGAPLGDATNRRAGGREETAHAREHVKEHAKENRGLLRLPKSDENARGKWWSLGRARKAHPPRAKTPEPLSTRFNSLDARALLGSDHSAVLHAEPPPVPPKDVPPPPPVRARSGTLTSVSTLRSASSEHGAPALLASSTFLAPPAPPVPREAQGSVALRAMKSMRSLARIKSFAALGAGRGAKEGSTNEGTAKEGNTKEGSTKEGTSALTPKDKKSKVKPKTKNAKQAARTSASSFEAGAPDACSTPLPPSQPPSLRTRASKLSLAGLLPGTLRGARSGTVRSTGSRVSSTASRAGSPPPGSPHALYAHANARLGAHPDLAAWARPASAYSVSSGAADSLRPPSTTSGGSVRLSVSVESAGASLRSVRSPRSSTSAASVRWDEDGLRDVRAQRRREREERRRDSKHSAEGRRRATVVEIFPELRDAAERGAGESAGEPEAEAAGVAMEEATAEEHGGDEDVEHGTPPKRARPRPMSEQLLVKMRPKAISDDGDGVISILDAATNDLASLINRLDLEATPASVQGSPIRQLRDSPSLASLGRVACDSPTQPKQCTPALAARDSFASLTSLRPYGQIARTHSNPAAPPTRQHALDAAARRRLVGQQIAPWHELALQVAPRAHADAQATVRPARASHRRTATPGPEDLAAFQPLRPAPAPRTGSVEALPEATPVPAHAPAAPTSQTFGADGAACKLGKSPARDLGYEDDAPPTPTPTVRRRGARADRASVLSVICDTGAALPLQDLKTLSFAGPLAGLEADAVGEAQPAGCEEGGSGDTEILDKMLTLKRRERAPSPGLPPSTPLPCPEDELELEPEAPQPTFRASLFDEYDNEADLDDVSDEEDHTKKSFDFTGELRLLTESGTGDRLSFVEQLENAFRTPADVSLGLQFEHDLRAAEAPPLPALQLSPRAESEDETVPHMELSTWNFDTSPEQSVRNSAASDTLDRLMAECAEDICRQYTAAQKGQGTMRSKESDGKLNRSFKFGGRPSIPDSLEESAELTPLTLSDIIPPVPSVSHSRSPSRSSLMDSDNSVLKSILGKAYEEDNSVIDSIVARAHAGAAVPRPRLDSDSSSRRRARESLALSPASTHSRNSSELSFKGFESFAEVRRGFEFHPNRPAFYPPPGAPKPWHGRYESEYSVATVSSYGATLDPGAVDPFGYAPSRPVSIGEETSFSMTVEDTFSFLKKGPQRQRVDSDASSFYFRPGAARGLRRNDSGSSARDACPPISIYNRGFGAHRRNDSNTSMSSVARSYANGNRASWARHRHQPSTDSIFEESPASNGGRPGLGDKMFDRMDYGMPLPAITASPTGSAFSSDPDSSQLGSDICQQFSSQAVSYDSIFDGQRTSVADSILEKTGAPASHDATDDVFSFDAARPNQAAFSRINQFRPISMMSTTSGHSIPQEGDTMISMIGGGHVRRRSIDSRIDGSPCIKLERKERKKHTALQHLARVLQYDQGPDELPSNLVDRFSKISPAKVILPKPSIASTSSFQFGSDQMIKPGKGLLERQNLEENAVKAQSEIIASLETKPVFTRPNPVGRSRSSTVTSSGGDTPPLSASDSSSEYSGSQSSIDLGHIDKMLTAATAPTRGLARARSMRMRARGTGHRRRMSSIRLSQSSVYETIEEEVFSSSPSPAKPAMSVIISDHETSMSKEVSLSRADSVYIVGDEEDGIIALRKYWALRDEVEETVEESKKAWSDTPFSNFAMQSFDPPKTLSGMQALLEHSQKSYGPLSSEFLVHRVRSRTSSRATPYPVRARRGSNPTEHQAHAEPPSKSRPFASPRNSLHDSFSAISINPAMPVFSPPPVPSVRKQASKGDTAKTANGVPRPRVTSSTRRAALGWSKRNAKENVNASTAKSTGTVKSGAAMSNAGTTKSNTGAVKSSTSSAHAKENAGTIFSASDSLRITRPRPRGRLAAARASANRAPLTAA
ncbi:hypothetical protein PsYK624_152830 [Phanerochaete sordida]|uniref:Uncharacterized protein n=1 Tax=Phanerochaete sordida TaxID=48140 RepID=A0A9P3LKW3_9APHY|nr:hypothetical protein PsYK624_152830 [Phanerochaete sordida]